MDTSWNYLVFALVLALPLVHLVVFILTAACTKRIVVASTPSNMSEAFFRAVRRGFFVALVGSLACMAMDAWGLYESARSLSSMSVFFDAGFLAPYTISTICLCVVCHLSRRHLRYFSDVGRQDGASEEDDVS